MVTKSYIQYSAFPTTILKQIYDYGESITLKYHVSKPVTCAEMAVYTADIEDGFRNLPQTIPHTGMIQNSFNMLRNILIYKFVDCFFSPCSMVMLFYFIMETQALR